MTLVSISPSFLVLLSQLLVIEEKVEIWRGECLTASSVCTLDNTLIMSDWFTSIMSLLMLLGSGNWAVKRSSDLDWLSSPVPPASWTFLAGGFSSSEVSSLCLL